MEIELFSRTEATVNFNIVLYLHSIRFSYRWRKGICYSHQVASSEIDKQNESYGKMLDI